MPEQVYNPLGFHCAPNQATPDYIAYSDLRQFVAYGFISCWLSADSEDPNRDCAFARPVTREDVDELRGYFLDLVETVILSLWKGDYSPGDGEIDGDWEHLYIGNEDDQVDSLVWDIRLDKDAMMFSLHGYGDAESIWLKYDAIEDKENVLKVLTEARQTISDNTVWNKLVEHVENPSLITRVHTLIKNLSREGVFDEIAGRWDWSHPDMINSLCDDVAAAAKADPKLFLIHLWGCTEPSLHGPYKDDDARLAAAKVIRAAEENDRMEDAYFRLSVDKDGVPDIDSFLGGEFDDEEDETPT